MDKISSKYNILILAAGVGKRMGKIGKRKPKCLLKLNNFLLIDYLINFLSSKNFKDINMVVGFQQIQIIKYLSKFRDIKINYIKINNFKTNGHGMSWFAYKKYFLKNKRKTIIIHADVLLHKKYFENIIKSKYPDIIGVQNIQKCSNKEAFYIREQKKYITEIKNKNLIKKPKGIVIGLNKVSINTMKKIFTFMDTFFKKKENKKLSWENVLNEFILKNPKIFKILNNQKYNWVNINKKKDLIIAKKLSKKNLFI